MNHLMLIGAGGFLGAIARYTVSGWVQQRFGGAFPLGTLIANVVGCLIIGALMSLVEDHPLLLPPWRAFIAVGILGAFTTFSTFGYETFALIEDRRTLAAGASVLLNVVLGLLAVLLGRAIVRAL